MFRQKAIAFIKKVPKGRAVSYGQVAAAVGSPRAARQVGTILKSLNPADGRVPWWRVVNNQGIISIKGNWTATKEAQRDLLLKDGVEVGKNFRVDMKRYRY